MPKKKDAKAEVVPIVSDEVIEETVNAIRAAAHDHMLSMVVKTGEIVIGKLYDGNLGTCRTRGAKDKSLRKLADRLDEEGMNLSAPTLYRACAVFELEQRIGVSALKHLTATHCYAVLPLPAERQQTLLHEANEQGWSTRKLEAVVSKALRKKRDGRGRPPLPRFVKSVHRLKKLLNEPDDSFGDLDAIAAMDASTAQELYQTVTGMKLQCEALQKALETRTPGFAPPE